MRRNFQIIFVLTAISLQSYWFIYSQSGSIYADTLIFNNIDQVKSRLLDKIDDDELVDALTYAHVYLKNAKVLEQNKIIADAYYYLYLLRNKDSSANYLDSLLLFSANNKISKYLGIGYHERGKELFNDGYFKDALDYYLLALDEIEIHEQPNLYFIIIHNIATIKDLIGQKSEALAIYKDYFLYLQKDGINRSEISNYLINIFALSHSFTENGLLDSASFYNKIGFSEAQKYEEPRHQAKFTLGEGYNLFYKKDYSNSFDSITKAIPFLKKANDKFNLAIGYLYAAKILSFQNSDYAEYLFLADTIITKEKRYYPQFIEIYELLYKHFKQKGNSKKQLEYLEKLFDYDRKLKSRYKSLHTILRKEYDEPKLLNEKEILIARLESSKKTRSMVLVVLSFLSICSLGIAYYFKRRRNIYKMRFEHLLDKGILDKTTDLKLKSSLVLPDELVNNVMSKIDLFEKNKGYLNGEISLNNLAKLMGTNSNYLSKIINNKKGKNYSNYINDLRIDYVIRELRENDLMRKFTIKAIANEIGFNSAESFSKAFFKRVGIYPSFYIRELNKSP